MRRQDAPRAEDGAITIRRRVPIADPADRPRHVASKPEITAPEGPHTWLNRAVYTGTSNGSRPEREVVFVRVFKLV